MHLVEVHPNPTQYVSQAVTTQTSPEHAQHARKGRKTSFASFENYGDTPGYLVPIACSGCVPVGNVTDQNCSHLECCHRNNLYVQTCTKGQWKNLLLRCANKWGLLHTTNPPFSVGKNIFDTNPSTTELERFLNSIDTTILATFTESNFSPYSLPVIFPSVPPDVVCCIPIEIWRCIAFFLPTLYLIACCCTSYTLMCTLWNAGKYDKVWIAPIIFDKLRLHFHTLSLQGGSSFRSRDAIEVSLYNDFSPVSRSPVFQCTLAFVKLWWYMMW